MEKKYIVGLGEILWDMLPSGRKIGGAPANFAFHVSQFGLAGLAVSATGDDVLGRELRAGLGEFGLESSLQLSPAPTSTVQVSVDACGVPCYDIVEGVAWDDIRFTDELRRVAAGTACVCFGTLAQRGCVSRKSIRAFLDAVPADAVKVFDINLRQHYYSEEVIRASLEKADILKINDEELDIVSDLFSYGRTALPAERCRALRSDFGLDVVILTCGTGGSHVVWEGGTLFRETPLVDVVDTVGAGDSFTAAFCASLLNGLGLEEAHEAAVRTSAYVCTRKGAMPELPDELKRLVVNA